MDWSESYNDICSQLRIVQIHEMEVRRRVEQAHAVMVTGEMPSSGSYCHLPLDKAITYYNHAVDALNEVQGEVDRLNAIKREMEQAMGGFTGLRNRIIYERKANGKRYKEIASEMGYTEAYLRQVASERTHKKRTQSTNAS